MWWAIRYGIYVVLRRIINLLIFLVNPPYLNKQSYDNLACVQRIILRCKPDPCYTASGGDFICFPARFVNAEYILQQNVSLYAVDESFAYFVETPDDIDIFSSTTDPFLYLAQFYNAQKLISMPLSTFHDLADKIALPKYPVVVVSSPGRCGSTLLSQIFETLDGVVSLGEPDAFTNLVWLRGRRKIDTDTYKTMVRSVVLVLCKPMDPSPRLLCIKTRCTCVQHVDTIYEAVPEIKHVFLYRNNLENIRSLERSFMGLKPIKLWWQVLRSPVLRTLFPKLADIEMISLFFFFSANPELYQWAFQIDYMTSLTPLCLWSIDWSLACAEYQRILEKGVPIFGIRYEDIIGNTEEICSKLNEVLELNDRKFGERAVEALKKDSQAGSTLSREALKNVKRLFPCPEECARINDILTRLGLPDLNQPTLLPNTLCV